MPKTRLAALILPMMGCFFSAVSAEPAAEPPPGAISFCLRNPSFCNGQGAATAPASAMPALISINRRVNTGISPGRLDTPEQAREENRNWRVVAPQGEGDCNEYAWTKFMLLAWSGIPMGAMRVAEVRVPQTGDLHVVLLVRTQEKVLVLDNLTPTIWPTSATNYEWLAIQDERTRMQWIKPDGPPR